MMVDRGNRDEVKRVEVVPRGESDHLPVVFEMRGERKEEECELSDEVGGERIIWRKEAEGKYAGSIAKKLSREESWEARENKWERIKEIIWETAREEGLVKERCGRRRDRDNKWTAACREARKENWENLKEWLKDRCIQKRKKYLMSKRKLKKIIREEGIRWRKERWEELDNARDMGGWWKALNRFRGKRKGEIGGQIKEERWVEHFSKLLNRGEGNGGYGEGTGEGNERDEESRCKYMTEEIKEEEIGKALGRMADGKATGEDGIPIECIKKIYGGAGKVLEMALNEVWKECKLPRGWECAQIVPIYKDGDRGEVGNYRGIALLDVGYKILTNIMAERLNKWVEEEGIIRESQAGFRKGRGTRDHIFVLNTLINKQLKIKGGKLYVAFVDLKAAFDSVDRKILMEKIWEVGVRGRMFEVIKEIYRENYAEVRMGSKNTRRFGTATGVRQGCALSAVLFDIFIDDLEKEWEVKGIGGTNIGGIKMKALKYADDIAVVAEDPKSLKKMLQVMEKYIGRQKLSVNTKKTKIVVFKNGGRRGKEEKWEFKGEELQEVKEFKYLGYWFESSNSHKKHMDEMARKAQKAANATWGVGERAGRGIKRERLYLMETLVKSVMMYGVEVWGCGEMERVERVQARYCKYTLGVAMNTPGYIWRSELGVRGIKTTARERVCRYMRDVMNMKDERWPKVCLKEECRAIMNNKPSKWGQKVKEMFEEMGVGEVIGWMWRGENGEKVYKRMQEGMNVWIEKERESDWRKIVGSTYNELYKEIMPGEQGAEYLNIRRKKREEIRTWARLRCGNIGRADKKGYKEWICRLCNRERETLQHLVICDEAWRIQDEGVRVRMQRWRESWGGNGEREELVKMLKGEVCSMMCEYVSKIEEKMRR